MTYENFLDVDELDEEKEIREGKAIKEMLATEGWKVLESALSTRLELVKNALLDTKDYQETMRLQEMAKLILAIQRYIKTKITNAERLEREKSLNLEEDDE